MEILRQPVQITNEYLPLIGREEYSLNTKVSLRTCRFSRESGIKITPNKHVRSALAFRFHYNSENASNEKFGNNRPASAYFTLLDGKLIIEWGEIDPEGNGKLHNYLNRNIDFIKRVKQGGLVRSGHIGWITTSDFSSKTRIALIDSIDSTANLTESSPEYPIITTLLSNNIVPVTTDGYPIAVYLDRTIKIAA